MTSKKEVSKSKMSARMSSRMSDIVIGLFIISMALIIAVSPKLFSNNFVASIPKLFNDTTNIILLVILTLCVSMVEPKMGLVLAFMIVSVAVYAKYNKFSNLETYQMEGFVNEYQHPRTYSVKLDGEEVKDREGKYVENMMNYSRNPNYFLKENDKLNDKLNDKNNNVAINQKQQKKEQFNMSSNTINQDTVNKVMEAKASAQVDYLATQKQLANNCSNTNNFLTQVAPNDYHGYDVVGCRYDLKSSPQNNSIYGPPLAWCATYDQSKLAKCGTLFYPLHG